MLVGVMKGTFKSVVRKTSAALLIERSREKLYFRLRSNRVSVNGAHNSIAHSGAHVSNISITINGDDNEIVFLPRSRIKNLKIRIDGSNHKVHIGKGCTINDGEFILSQDDGSICIGDSTFINSANLYSSESAPIEIGSKCGIAWDIEIYTGDFHPIYDRKTNERINGARGVSIADDVFIGAHVLILKGVTIGPDTVVGAGSTVASNVPANCIVAGTPARVVRKDIYWGWDLPETNNHKKPR